MTGLEPAGEHVLDSLAVHVDRLDELIHVHRAGLAKASGHPAMTTSVDTLARPDLPKLEPSSAPPRLGSSYVTLARHPGDHVEDPQRAHVFPDPGLLA